MVQTFHTPPVQRQTVQLKVLGEYWLNQPWKERRQTRWRRAWHVLFVRTYCMTLSGVSGLLCHLLSHWHGKYHLCDRESFQVCLCLSLQPCMHVFCAACYSGWMERSSHCPTCRCPVERIRKSHIFNNLVEAYLIQHPGLFRSRWVIILSEMLKHLLSTKS